jgi:hypothetical protein
MWTRTRCGEEIHTKWRLGRQHCRGIGYHPLVIWFRHERGGWRQLFGGNTSSLVRFRVKQWCDQRWEKPNSIFVEKWIVSGRMVPLHSRDRSWGCVTPTTTKLPSLVLHFALLGATTSRATFKINFDRKYSKMLRYAVPCAEISGCHGDEYEDGRLLLCRSSFKCLVWKYSATAMYAVH